MADSDYSALTLRPQYDVTSDSKAAVVQQWLTAEDEDINLRAPYTPHGLQQQQASTIFLYALSWQESVLAEYFVEPKASTQLRGGLAILVSILCTLLSSMVAAACQKYAEKGWEFLLAPGHPSREEEDRDSKLSLLSQSGQKTSPRYPAQDRRDPSHPADKKRGITVERGITKDRRMERGITKNRGITVQRRITNNEFKTAVFEIMSNDFFASDYSNSLKGKPGDTFRLFNSLRPAPLSLAVYPATLQRSGVRHQWPADGLADLPWSSFSQELYRIGTFVHLPRDFPVSALRLAQAGFLRLADASIVCFFCGLVRNEWSSRDVPAQVHRELRPDCPVVTGVGCSNVSVAGQLAQSMQRLELQGGEGGTRLARVDGAASLALHVSEDGASSASAFASVAGAQASGFSVAAGAQSLSSAPQNRSEQPGQPPQHQHQQQAQAMGFSLSAGAHPLSSAPQNLSAQPPQPPQQQQQQQQRPPPRMGLLGGGPANTDPHRHRILDGTAQPEPLSSPPQALTREEVELVTFAQLGIVTGSPRRRDMASVQSRLDTYRSQLDTAGHTPLQLAEAGFYYAGYGDCSRCFFCAGGLKNWEAEDDPWVAHARYFPACAYVRQCLGQVFINVVKELVSENQTQEMNVALVKREIARRHPGADSPALSIDPAVDSTVSVGYDQLAAVEAAQRMSREGQQVTVESLMENLQAEGIEPRVPENSTVPDIPDNAAEETSSLRAANSDLREQRQCKMCLDRPVSVIFLPCGHLVSCVTCSPVVLTCPLCRLVIKGRVRTFAV